MHTSGIGVQSWLKGNLGEGGPAAVCRGVTCIVGHDITFSITVFVSTGLRFKNNCEKRNRNNISLFFKK